MRRYRRSQQTLLGLKADGEYCKSVILPSLADFKVLKERIKDKYFVENADGR
jgi:hypothetical protein